MSPKMKPIVHFADFRCSDAENLQQKFTRLLKTAGLGKIDLADKFVAIKLHFGEAGNMSYLRPNWVKTLADFVKAQGGRPFLTDANTLYVGQRKHALDLIAIAYENGFSPFSTGCHVLIADGLKGTDDVAVPLPDGKYVKEAYIGRALVDADVIISLTHFKCHEMTGIGGALKNLGMGGGSRAGKKAMHSSVHPQVEQANCIGCGKCTKECAHGACTVEKNAKGRRVASIDPEKCVGCGRCIGACNRDAIVTDFGEPCTVMHGKIAEYTAAVVRGKPAFHISFVCDVSPHCDCHPMNDAPLVPDIGMAASFDPVALDKACADLCNAAPVMPNCCLAGQDTHGDIFATMHPVTRWQDAISEGERMGLGSGDYKLVNI